jgi:tight adherence protein B
MTLIHAFSILVFLAVALAAGGVLLYRGGATSRALERRLRGLGAPDRAQREVIEVERDVRYSRLRWLDGLLRSLRVGERLEMVLYKSGLNMRPGVLVLLVALFALGGYLVGVTLFKRVAPGLLIMAVAGPLPYLYVLYRKAQRMKAFSQEFPDALDLLVSALRAGLSFAAAMQIVSEESPEPIRSEFAVTVEEQALGLDFREALVNLTRRVDSLDLRFFVTAVILQRDTGGNLAEILESTARLIRERFKVLGDIRTFTAHGRLTGTFLMLLPAAMALFTWALNPDYFKPMLEADGGRNLLIAAAIMQILGMLVIRRIVNIRV